MTFTLPEPPSANRYWRLARGRLILWAEAREYRRAAADAMLAQGLAPKLRGLPFPAGTMVRVSLEWHRSIKSGDLDNRLKQSLDVLKGVVYADDAQVVEIHATRHEAPRAGKLVVGIWAAKGFRREAA